MTATEIPYQVKFFAGRFSHAIETAEDARDSWSWSTYYQQWFCDSPTEELCSRCGHERSLHPWTATHHSGCDERDCRCTGYEDDGS